MSTHYGDKPMYIGGKFVASESGAWMDTYNPATGEVHGRVPAATAADIDAAVQAAAQAQIEWGAKSVWERGKLLRDLAARIRERADDVLTLESADTGNTIASLGNDITLATGYLEFVAGLGIEIKGESIPATAENIHFTMRQPYGVVGRIVPFNHPFCFAGAHLGAPLIAGNTVVLKSPDQSPLSATVMADICHEVLPPGVVNIVSGEGIVAGDAIVRHPQVPRIGFTGSVPTGLAIQRSAAEVAVKHITLELGGKNPFIAFPDADPQAVAKAAVAGMNFSWSGQSCGSTSRLMLHESIYDEVVDLIAASVGSIELGDPLDPQAGMGPVNSAKHYAHVMNMINAGKEDGARVICGGDRGQVDGFPNGYWVQPTVFADVTMQNRVAREEVFGPVLSILKWSDTDTAIDMANELELGLTAAIFTNDIKTAMATARRVESGCIWINGTGRHYMGSGFAGWKNSGLGREECLEEVLSYTRSKSIHIIM